MKRIITSVIAILLVLSATAQEQGNLTKEEKKALKQEQKKQTEIILIRNTSEAIKARQFVLKADQLRGRTGYNNNVDPTLNFVAVEGMEAYVQVSSPWGLGYNGVGGVTLHGKITSFELKKQDKHGNYHIILNTVGSAGNLTIFLNISKTGEYASATVNTIWGGRVEMMGKLVPWTGTGKDIYKGTETY